MILTTPFPTHSHSSMNFTNMTELTNVNPTEGFGPIPYLYGVEIYWMIASVFLILTFYGVFRMRFYDVFM